MAKSKRKPISASLRWQVFARDNFTCRYCGAQAGQEGVHLAADHVLSVADGGDNSIDNLITACQDCNGGKGARSLMALPDAEAVEQRMRERADSIRRQAESIRASIESEKELLQEAINLKCEAYQAESSRMDKGEEKHIIKLCREFGAETVLDWYRAAYRRGVSEFKAVRYVCGIARNVRKSLEVGDA